MSRQTKGSAVPATRVSDQGEDCGTRWRCSTRLVVVVLLALAPRALAQGTDVLQGPTVESFQARIAALQAEEALDPAVQEQAVSTYQNAIKLLEAAHSSRSAAEASTALIQSAPQETQTQRALLDTETFGLGQLPDSANADRTELEQALADAQALAATIRGAAVELNTALRQTDARRPAANLELTTARRELVAIESPESTPPAGTGPVADALLAQHQAKRRSTAARVFALEQEIVALPARHALLQAKVAVLDKQKLLVDQRVSALQARLQEALQHQAALEQAAAEQASEAFANQHPVIAAQADRNAELGRQLNDLVTDTSRLASLRQRAAARRMQLEDSEAAVAEAMGIGARSQDYSEILRRIRDELPSLGTLGQAVTAHQKLILDARLARLRLRAQLRSLENISEAAGQLLAATAVDQPPPPSRGRDTLNELLTKRRSLLEQVISAYDTLITIAEQLIHDQADLQTDTAALLASIRERLVWLPNAPVLGRASGEHVRMGLAWFLQPPGGWSGVLQRAIDRLMAHVPSSLFGAALVGLLFTLRRGLRTQEAAIAERIGRYGLDGHTLTPRAIAIALLRSLPVPVALVFIGVLLRVDAAQLIFDAALGHGLIGTGIVIAILGTFHAFSTDNGVFDAHLGWTPRARLVLDRNLRWLMVVLVPVTIVVAMTDASGIDANRYGVGRLAFIVASLALSAFFFHVLQPQRGAFTEMLRGRPIIWRTRFVWFGLVVLIPLALAGIAAYGYYDTASEIQDRLFWTGWVLLLGLVTYSTLARSVVVIHRRMALQRAHEARELARATREQKSAAEAAGEAVPELDISEIDLSSVSAQTRQIILAAVLVILGLTLWLIWSGLVPALGVLDKSAAWHRTVGTEAVAVSWGAVLTCALILLATIVAYRNLPGFLESTVFRLGSLDRGSRFAVSTIAGYVILGIGVVIALQRIGWDWSRAQWVVAALGVGLGFGLQEIVANFASGIIILLERPIRVGDAVTIGGLSGTVSRMQIRATTITDWDNLEIIVPNKDLITQQVTNWTLTSTVTRVVVKVGVEYASNPEEVQRILLETAKSVGNVRSTPPPSVFFLGFGDSSLNFEVRAFVSELGHRVPVTHELHRRIHRALNDAGIEIPFPQRDLHMKPGPSAVQADDPAPDCDDPGDA